MLRRIDGPACPRCGCQDSEPLLRDEQLGRRMVRRRCNHCAHSFSAAAEVIYYPILVCPRCQSRRVPVYSTQLPVRYHKCQDCGGNFKSIEKTG